MHRDLACELLASALESDEDADLVGGRVDIRRDRAAGAETSRADDDDVLAELADQLQPLLLEAGDGVRAVGMNGAEDSFAERLELVVSRDGLGLAADTDDRADAVGHDRADETLGRRAVGPLARLAIPRSRNRTMAESMSPPSPGAPLALHHPCARAVAELLDEPCADVGGAHSSSLPSTPSATATGSP